MSKHHEISTQDAAAFVFQHKMRQKFFLNCSLSHSAMLDVVFKNRYFPPWREGFIPGIVTRTEGATLLGCVCWHESRQKFCAYTMNDEHGFPQSASLWVVGTLAGAEVCSDCSDFRKGT